jgi:hypothetical protein
MTTLFTHPFFVSLGISLHHFFYNSFSITISIRIMMKLHFLVVLALCSGVEAARFGTMESNSESKPLRKYSETKTDKKTSWRETRALYQQASSQDVDQPIVSSIDSHNSGAAEASHVRGNRQAHNSNKERRVSSNGGSGSASVQNALWSPGAVSHNAGVTTNYHSSAGASASVIHPSPVKTPASPPVKSVGAAPFSAVSDI